MTRWMGWCALALTAACDGGDTDPVDTDPDTDPVVDTDTDVEIVQWADRRVETSETLYGVYAGGTGSWVVGTGGTMWRIESGGATPITTGLSEDIDLQGLWGSGDTAPEIVAVGTFGTRLHYASGEFTVFDGDSTASFRDVDGTSGHLTAVGAGGIYNWDGTSWAFQSVAGTWRLAAVRVGVSTDFAVGDDGTILTRSGGDWTAVTAVTSANLHAISGTADNEIWAVGEEGTVLHFDGTAWTVVDIGVETTLWGVWQAPDSQEVFVVGNNGVALKGGVEGFEPIATGVDANLYAVTGSSSTDVWAVGNRGQVLRYTGPVD